MRMQQLSVLAVLIAACETGDDLPTSPPPAPALQFSMVGGQQQEAVPGEALPLPFTVKVTDGTGGVPGVQVTWTLLSGAGTFLSATTVLTDARGEAAMRFTPATYRVAVSATINTSRLALLVFRTLPPPLDVYVRLPGSSGCSVGGGCERYILY